MEPELHDDVIERELRRRASGAWQPDRVLPAVRRATEMRTERVAAPRWAALVGLAGVLAVLVLLAVALPTLAPGPVASPTADPAASPRSDVDRLASPTADVELPPSPATDSPPEILSTAVFVARLANGELNGSTVLVSGRIEEDVTDGTGGSPPCFPDDEDCVDIMGGLGGTADEVAIGRAAIATTEEEAIIAGGARGRWHWWTRPVAPVEGILVLSVDDHQAVEYLGRVRQRGGSPAASPTELASLDPRELAPDDILLIDGWLAGIGGPVSCIPIGEDEEPPDLPSLRCGYGESWLADVPDAPVDNGVRVQNHAYERYSREPGDGDDDAAPRRGLYAVSSRLYGGGCLDSEAPCWDWAIVARVSAVTPTAAPPDPTSSTSPTVTSSPSAPATGLICDRGSAQSVRAVIFDERGIVLSCSVSADLPLGVWTEDFAGLVSLRNPGEDVLQLQVMFPIRACDTNVELTLDMQRGNHSLVVKLTEPDPSCEALSGYQSVSMELREPLNLWTTDFATNLRSPAWSSSVPPLPELPRGTRCHYRDVMGQDPSVGIVDNVGVVESCSTTVDWEDVPSEGQVAVRQAGDDEQSLEFYWRVECFDRDMPAHLELTSVDTGLELVVHREATASCKPAPARQGVIVSFSERTSPEDVVVGLAGWQRGSNAIVRPTPPPSQTTIMCTGAPSPPDNGAVWVVDHTDSVRGCNVAGAEPADSGISARFDPPSITLTWTVPCASDIQVTRLDFWDRSLITEDDRHPWHYRSPYLLSMTRMPPTDTSAGCFTAISGRQVTLLLDAPIDVSDIDVVVTDEGRALDRVEQSGGDFEFALESSRVTYEQGEPLNVTAALIFERPGASIRISGLSLAIGLEQLDGPLALEPALSTQMCVDNGDLEAGVPRVYEYISPETWSSEDPDATFYEQYTRDGQFVLPPGTYLIYASASFAIGAGCTGEGVEFSTAIVITVR